jgi:hypothetical protein
MHEDAAVAHLEPGEAGRRERERGRKGEDRERGRGQTRRTMGK